MERINTLDNIQKSKKYDIALLTTFNLELGFFERSILNKLYDNGTRKVSLFADSKEYIKALKDVELSYIGSRYVVTPVEMNSSFHPKLILLLGKEKAKLFVGSCNLTTPGYYINNEISNMFEYDLEHKENISLIQDAMNFFLELNERTDKRDNSLIQKIRSLPYYEYEKSKNNNVQLIYNINKTIIEQVRDLINGNVKEIDIAVPYFDSEASALKEIQALYPNSIINLYIQNEKNTFPKKFKEEYNINLYNKFFDNGSYHFYHGKVFRFVTDKESFVLYGSANCTNAAFTKSANAGGNIECDILARGGINEYDGFFNNFAIEDGLEFRSDILTFDKVETSNYSYKNNVANTLYFKCIKKYEDLKIFLMEQEIEYKYDDNDISVVVHVEFLNKLSSVFKVKFKYQNREEIIDCYFNDIEQIERNRNLQLSYKIPDINISPDINAKTDMYIKDRIELITRFGFMYDIFNEKLDYYVKDVDSKDSEINDDLEDFIDYDYKLSDEVQVKIKTLDQIFKANNRIFHLFRNHILSLGSDNQISNNSESDKKTNNGSNERKPRIASSDEKSFARIVNNISRDMLNKTNSNKLDFSNYIKCIVSLFEVYNRFMIRENVTDMFEESKVIEVQFNLIKELTNKFNNNISEEEKEMYLWLAFACILQTNYINKTSEKVDYKKDLMNRDLLKQINNRFNIRESYENYLDVSLKFINQSKERMDKDFSKGYIESLFEYRTESQIKKMLDKNFGSDYVIDSNGNVITIIINTDNISNYFKLNNMLIKDLIKSYCSDEKFSALKIVINNIDINPNFPDPPVKIEYLFNRGGIGQQTILQKKSSIRSRMYSVR